MVRNVDHEQRRKAVLRATINQYITGAAPIASEDIADEFRLSSATIRSIFAELESDGYIRHPYTSGGRIPTKKGYRYYVDFLISQAELLEDQKKRIIQEYKKELSKFEDVLEMTSGVIAAMTHYAGMVSFMEWHDKLFYRGMSVILEQPEFHDLTRIRLLMKLIEDKRRLLDIINRHRDDTTRIYIGEELGFPEMGECALVVSTYRMKDRPSGKIAVLGPMRMPYPQVISMVEYISTVMTAALNRI